MNKTLLLIVLLFLGFISKSYSQACDNCTSTSLINAGLIACYPFNGNANDESGNGNNGTSNGATLTTDRFGVADKAYHFDGSSYINIPNSNSLKSPDTTITIAMWFNVESWFVLFGSVNYASLLCKSNNTANTQYRLTVNDNGLDVIINGKQAILSLTSTIQLNRWYQVVAVARTNDVTFYLDGNKLGTTSYTGTFPSDSTSGLDLGRDYAGTVDFFTGKLDDIRLYNRALSDEEVRQIYSIKPTPPTNVSAGSDVTISKGSSVQLQGTAIGGVSYVWSPAKDLDDSTLLNPNASPDTTTQYILTVINGDCNVSDTVLVTVTDPVVLCDNCGSSIPLNNGLVVCYPFNGNTKDESGNGNHGINNGATLTTDRFGNTNRAYSFNGTSDYIDLSQNLPDLTTLTFSLWVNPSANNNSSRSIFFEGDAYCGNDLFIYYQNGTLSFGADKGGAQMDGTSGAGVVSVNIQNTWAHVAWTMTSTQSLVYVNGSLVATFNKTGSAVGYHHIPSFGSFNDGDGPPCGSPRGAYFQGSIDDIRLYNRALSSSEIQQLYKLDPSPPIVNAGSDRNICLGDSIQLSVTGAVTYLWAPATGLSDSTIANPYCKPTDTLTYIVKGINGTCSNYDTLTVNVTPVQVDAGTVHDICQGDSIQLNGTATGTFVWSPSSGLSNDHALNPYAKPTNTTKYYLTATNGACQQKDSVTINVISGLTIDAGADQKICIGDSVQLLATGGTSYTWSPSTGINDTSIANPKVSPGSTIDYVVRSGTSGCFYYDTIEVEVNQKPVVDAGNDITNCVGNIVTMHATSSGATDFVWAPASGLNNPAILNPDVTINNVPVKYVITASNDTTGCFSQDSLMVLPDTVHADFTADKYQGMSPLTVNFTNQSYNATQTFWFFDSTNANPVAQPNPQHTYTNSGTYAVTLIAMNSNGCSDTATGEIIVLTNQSVFIPNAFTPNGDDVNEQFKIVYNEAVTKKIRGSIWNRWGGRMYEFTMPGENWWDGKEDGEYVIPGVYFYIIYVEDIFGKTVGFKGTVTLLR